MTDSIANIQINIYRCERGRVGNVLNSVMFPLKSNLFIISRSTTPLNFTDLNSYFTEISSQNKFFNMYIVKEKATRKFLMQNFLPGMFKMTNFDRFHRKATVAQKGQLENNINFLLKQNNLLQIKISCCKSN